MVGQGAGRGTIIVCIAGKVAVVARVVAVRAVTAVSKIFIPALSFEGCWLSRSIVGVTLMQAATELGRGARHSYFHCDYTAASLVGTPL